MEPCASCFSRSFKPGDLVLNNIHFDTTGAIGDARFVGWRAPELLKEIGIDV